MYRQLQATAVSRSVALDAASKERLHAQLVKLGDMMGDGLHHEPDGKWIEKEYRAVAKALGLLPKRKSNAAAINKALADALTKVACSKCGGQLKQTKSGALRASCVKCGERFQFKRTKVPK